MLRRASPPLLAIVAGFLLIPLLWIVVDSFRDGLGSYERSFTNPNFRTALGNSLLVSSIVTLLSGCIGVAGAIAARTAPPRLRRMFLLAAVIPLLTPELLIAIGAAQWYHLLGIPKGWGAVVLGHTSFGVPLFFLLTDGALSAIRFERLVDAARDLGASERKAIRTVVLPLLRPHLIAAAMLVWAFSLDDFVLSFFLLGPGESLLTIRMHSLLRHGLSPEIHVACVLLFGMVVTAWGFSLLAGRKHA